MTIGEDNPSYGTAYGTVLPNILLHRVGGQHPLPPGARGPVDRGGAAPQAVGDGAGRIAADLQGEIGDALPGAGGGARRLPCSRAVA